MFYPHYADSKQMGSARKIFCIKGGYTMKQVIFWVMVLIGLFLVATNATKLNTVLLTLSDTSLKGIATLQGRNVKGVTY
jgi:hypothetical protein